MQSQDLYETVVAFLNAPTSNLSEIERETKVPRKTLHRIKNRQNDSRHGTLKRIAQYFDKPPA